MKYKVNNPSMQIELNDQLLIIWTEDVEVGFLLDEVDLNFIEDDIHDNNALSGSFDCIVDDLDGLQIGLINVNYLVIYKP